jgi:hypothetical protein
MKTPPSYTPTRANIFDITIRRNSCVVFFILFKICISAWHYVHKNMHTCIVKNQFYILDLETGFCCMGALPPLFVIRTAMSDSSALQETTR